MITKSVKVEDKTYLVHAKNNKALNKAIKDLKALLKKDPDIEDKLPPLEAEA